MLSAFKDLFFDRFLANDFRSKFEGFYILWLDFNPLLRTNSSYLESHDSLVSEGKKQYEVIARDARMPRYGDCWKEALADLTTGCK